MSPEHELSNIESWHALERSIEEYPDNALWTPWKILARRFVDEGVNVGLSRYFRAGQSMHHLMFSTLDHHGLRRGELHVTVVLHPQDAIRVAYGTKNLNFGFPELEYTLPFEPGFATFRRFLNQLWTDTMCEAIPDELRGFSAPVLMPVAPWCANPSV